jgi:hypothetical protein
MFAWRIDTNMIGNNEARRSEDNAETSILVDNGEP